MWINEGFYLSVVLVVVLIISKDVRGANKSNPKYIMDIPGCKIPFVPLLSKAVLREFEVEFEVSCPRGPDISSLSEEGELTLLEVDNGNPNCCYTEIMRPNEMTEDKFELSECHQFPSSHKVKIPNIEFLFVKCGNEQNPKLKFHSQIPFKSRIQEKMKFWKEFSSNDADKDIPFSIMLLVLDAVDRQHAVRSLPKTVKFMDDEMDFVDFKGHHVIGHSTFMNLLPMMLGMPFQEFNRQKKNIKGGKFDEIPFIWKNFSQANYVTLYIEDNPTWHTFNFNKRTGFIKQPEDFYTRPYFLALDKLNRKLSRRYLKVTHHNTTFKYNSFACVEDKFVYDYILDYGWRFLSKFNPKKIPTFGINWLVWPHHDHFSALKTIDTSLFNLFKRISKSSDILENTILILTGDHGFKWAKYSSTREGLLEQNMALLKIRLPDRFKMKYPKHTKNIYINSKERITSHIDMFKTLADVHKIAIESFGSENSQENNHYGYNKPYGYSLFSKIPINRTCKKAKLDENYCGCNYPLYSDEDFKKYIKDNKD